MRLTFIPFAALAVVLAAPASANDRIGTIDRGNYVCELPGDAAGAAGHEQPAANFRIASSSRYSTSEGTGTYLLKGDQLEMTSGPRKGDRYLRMSNDFLRKLDPDGKPGRLRCVRSQR